MATKKKARKKKGNHGLIVLVIVILVVAAGVFGLFNFSNDGGSGLDLGDDKVPGEINNVFDEAEIKTLSDGTKYIINPSEIRDGGPRKGGIGVDRGIPALDESNIKFVSVEEADEWIADNELVLALNYKGVERVYPLQIMTWHEIANDVLVTGEGEVPLAITYCPLCGSGIAYDRRIDVPGKGQVVAKFGTSGKLYNSNLIMYDDETDTYWQQIEGLAIVGELTGQKLNEISLDTVVWRDWSPLHPDAEVLSQDTGISRNYGKDPYANYFENSFLFFPVENEADNPRVTPKDVIFGIEVNREFKAYKEEDLKSQNVIEDVVAGVNVRGERMDDGIVTFVNKDTGEEIIKERDFWFAWYAFHPETDLWEK